MLLLKQFIRYIFTLDRFSAVTLMLLKQRNCLLIHKWGDLRLDLTDMSPNISNLC